MRAHAVRDCLFKRRYSDRGWDLTAVGFANRGLPESEMKRLFVPGRTAHDFTMLSRKSGLFAPSSSRTREETIRNRKPTSFREGFSRQNERRGNLTPFDRSIGSMNRAIVFGASLQGARRTSLRSRAKTTSVFHSFARVQTLTL